MTTFLVIITILFIIWLIQVIFKIKFDETSEGDIIIWYNWKNNRLFKTIYSKI